MSEGKSAKFFKFAGILLFSAFVCTVSGEIYFEDGTPRVKFNEDAVLSANLNTSRDGRPYVSFMGIPFATIPERFARAELIQNETWKGVKAFTKAGPTCVQFASAEMLESKQQSEDCLTLNVHIPMTASPRKGGPLPTMVYVHEGIGSGSQYYPTFFMDEDVIIITINYRIGVFGFLSTGDSVIPGNNGLKDIVVALKWVQEKISKFGGDPNQVTVFGDGSVVHYLLLTQETDKLFSRAILQSGTVLAPWFEANPRRNALKLAQHLNCSTTASSSEEMTSAEMLTCLQNAPTSDLDMAQYTIGTVSWIAGHPCPAYLSVAEPAGSENSTDLPFLTEIPAKLVDRKGRFPEIPVMLGMTEDEGAGWFAGLIMRNETMVEELSRNWSYIAPNIFRYEEYLSMEDQNIVSDKLKKSYFDDKPISAENRKGLTDIFSDVMVTYGTWKTAREAAATSGKHSVYLYEYAYHGPISIMGTVFPIAEEEQKLVGHADDLQHQFVYEPAIEAIKAATNGTVNPRDKEFSRNLIKLWVSFAKHGEPKHTWGNHANQQWTPVTKEQIDGKEPMKWYKINSDPELVEEKLMERMELWDKLWQDYYIPSMEATVNSTRKS